MADAQLLKVRKMLEDSPHLTDKEFRIMMSHPNDEDNIDNLNFDKKKPYSILDHIVINPCPQAI